MTIAYNEDQAFARVMQACRAAEAKGWIIGRGGFVFADPAGRRYCCPMMAVVIDATDATAWPREGVKVFKQATGLARNLGDFTIGVDDMGWFKTKPKNSRAARLARRVRAALWGDA